jgi:hypothetical protein
MSVGLQVETSIGIGSGVPKLTLFGCFSPLCKDPINLWLSPGLDKRYSEEVELMIRGIRRPLLYTVAMTALLVVPLTGSANAAAAPEKQEKCVFIAEKAKPGTDAAPLRKVCGDEASVAAAAADRTLLMTFYEHANFEGYPSDIYGDYGTCDAQGYSFDFSARYWGWTLSSFRVHGRCWLSDYKNRSQQWSPTHAGPVSYVGDNWNDNIAQFRIRAQGI